MAERIAMLREHRRHEAANDDDRHLIAIVPARNEQATVGNVVADLIAIMPSADILVVNDGSADGTANRRSSSRRPSPRLAFPLRVDAAMSLGYRIADREGYEWALPFDADGQHTASLQRSLARSISRSASDHPRMTRCHTRTARAQSRCSPWPPGSPGCLASTYSTRPAASVSPRLRAPRCSLPCKCSEGGAAPRPMGRSLAASMLLEP